VRPRVLFVSPERTPESFSALKGYKGGFDTPHAPVPMSLQFAYDDSIAPSACPRVYCIEGRGGVYVGSTCIGLKARIRNHKAAYVKWVKHGRVAGWMSAFGLFEAFDAEHDEPMLVRCLAVFAFGTPRSDVYAREKQEIRRLTCVNRAWKHDPVPHVRTDVDRLRDKRRYEERGRAIYREWYKENRGKLQEWYQENKARLAEKRRAKKAAQSAQATCDTVVDPVAGEPCASGTDSNPILT
jgi:hypothetical protein